MTITDNQGFILSPVVVRPVNAHDTTLLPEAFSGLIPFSHRIGMDLKGSFLTLDSGFDAKADHKLIKEQGLVPVIYPNKRRTKEPIAM